MAKFPFGIDPTEKQVAGAVDAVRAVYYGTPETTCCSLAECCSAGMPNIYFSEFLAIRRGAVDVMNDEQRTNLTVECIRRYLQTQEKKKPCAFLKENKCSIYENRPLKCRLYGLIPNDLYDEVAEAVAAEMKRPRAEVPLCTQCPLVKVKPEFLERFPDGKVPRSAIENMENSLRKLDRDLGMKKETQDQGFGFLTYHDWHLLFEFGEEWMEKLTKLRISWNDEKKEQFILSLKSALEARSADESTKETENGK